MKEKIRSRRDSSRLKEASKRQRPSNSESVEYGSSEAIAEEREQQQPPPRRRRSVERTNDRGRRNRSLSKESRHRSLSKESRNRSLSKEPIDETTEVRSNNKKLGLRKERDESPNVYRRGRSMNRNLNGASGSSCSRSPSVARSPSVERIQQANKAERKAKLAEHQARRRAEMEERRNHRRETSLEARHRGAADEESKWSWLGKQLFEVELVLRRNIECEEGE